MRPRLILTCILALCATGHWQAARAQSANVSVAAAANLTFALEALHTEFKRTHPDLDLRVTTAASGTLFAQIKNGAPFDVFLSADVDYPHRLVAERQGDPATLRTFATGRLVLWTTRNDLDLSDLATAARHPGLNKLAIAQPATAPYGRAAEAALEHAGVLAAVRPRIVYGESITQTAQFVETGNADAGLVALSLVLSPKLARLGRWREIPPAHYARVSLGHALVLTLRGASNPAARRYLDFIASEPAKKILRDFGYATPERN